MGQSTQKQTLVYGEVVPGDERLELTKSADKTQGNLRWLNEPTLLHPEGGATTVFVDLDDPRFAASEFLVSVATAGDKVRIVGKSDRADDSETIHFAKMGVAEIVDSDECLKRLSQLLEAVEPIPPTKSAVPKRFSIESIIGSSESSEETRRTIRLLSEVDFPSALILGETGTGKSLICKVLHNTGVRSRHNLVEVNCSAIPDDLFESELFGHVKGAFTGADSDKQGLFEYAEGGTLFLDEVGNLSASAQAKLLKILEDKKIRKVGAIYEGNISVRVVAATNLDLTKAIEAGSFREDLYYRLNLLTVMIQPLRKRPQDIPDLIEYYTEYFAKMYAKAAVSISSSATKDMLVYHWPGNVRELCNVIERAVLLCQGSPIKSKDIKLALKKGRLSIADRQQIIIDVPTQGVTLAEVEQQVVSQVLNLFEWNKSNTAKFLGISRPRLRRIIEAGGLEKNRRKQ